VLLVAFSGCAGSTTTIGATSTVSTAPGGNVNWTVGVQVGINVARDVLPSAQAALDSDPALHPGARPAVDEGFRIALNALDMAQTALDTVSHPPSSAPALCQVRFYVKQAITGALQALTIARDAGAQIDPRVTAAIGSLAAISDMLLSPSCQSGNPPARHASDMEVVNAALARH
jgi:hypothetical protein